MRMKVKFHLTNNTLTNYQKDINKLIVDIGSCFKNELCKKIKTLLEQMQIKLIKSIIGKPYKLKNKRINTPWHCSGCKNARLFRRKGTRTKQRVLLSKHGPIYFKLYQIQCCDCGKVFAPILNYWRLFPYQRYFPNLLKDIIELALDMPYSTTSSTSKKLLEIKTPHKSTIKRWVDRLGSKCKNLPPTSWESEVVLADSTRVKAGKSLRGEIIQVMLSSSNNANKTILLGNGIGKDWKSLLQSARSRNATLLITDGDDYISSAKKRINWDVPVQRCLWHMPHQGRHYMFRDGLSVKYHLPWIKRMNKILFTKNKHYINNCKNLIKDLYKNDLKMTATYFKNALSTMWTYKKFKDIVPKTTSIVEREMREINRRTDVGVRWSTKGVQNLLNLKLGCRYKTDAWKNLWLDNEKVAS